MSGSETGVMSSANISVPRPSSAAMPQPVMHSIRMSYNPEGGAPVYNPVSGGSPAYQQASGNGGHTAGEQNMTMISMGGNMGMNFGEPMKKKRGRPRKYGPDGSIALSLSSTQSPTSAISESPNPFSASPVLPPIQPPVPLPISGSGGGDVIASPSSSLGAKKPRGRPPGSGKKHQYNIVGSLAIGFTPHVIIVKAGEDVSSRIMSFAQNGPRGVCILSANGAISNVTLRQTATSGGTVTYEGRFEILSLSGSFMLSETGGQRSRIGGLSVSLAGPDGRVLGGGVAGMLTAATPVQVVVGSFVPEGQKQSRPVNHLEAMSAPPKIHPGIGAAGGSSPPSRGTLSESSGGGSGSPFNQDYRNLQ